MPVICPGCRTELDPTADSCHICLRRRSRREIFRGTRQELEEKAWARKRPRLAALALAGALAAAYAARSSGVFRAALQAASSGVAAARAPSAPAAASPSEAPAPAPLKPYTLAPPPPPGVDPNVWLVRGGAYDLIELKPVAKARLIFSAPFGGKAYQAVTDAKGRYQIKLPRLDEGGYALTVRRAGYPPGFLEEEDLPYRDRSLARRREAAELLSGTEVLHVPVLLESGEHVKTLTVILYRPR